MAKKSNHLHRYRKTTIGNKGWKIFKCTIPGCTHYIAHDVALGRLCECNRCGRPMTLTKANMTLAKPHCDDCVERKDDSHDKIQDLVTKLGV